MTKDEGMTKAKDQRMSEVLLVIRASSLIRHSPFAIRHFANSLSLIYSRQFALFAG